MVGEVVALRREAQLGQAVEDEIERDVLLQARQPGARAVCLADGEGDVAIGVGAFDVEIGGAREHVGIAVGGGVAQMHGGALRDRNAGDRGVGEDEPVEPHRRRFHPQRLLDEVADLRPVGEQLGVHVGTRQQQPQPRRQRERRRLVAADVEMIGHADDLGIGQGALTVKARLVGEERDHRVVRVRSLLSDRGVDVVLEGDALFGDVQLLVV